MRDLLLGRRGRLVSVVALGAAMLMLVAGCGKETPKATPTGIDATKDATIAAEVPSAIAAKGTLTIAADAAYAPNEFMDANNQIVGMDVDLGKALGQVLGLEFKFVNATFDGIIPGLAAGRYDIGMSSFTDTKEREKTVDFVTYFVAGTSFYTAVTGGPAITGLDSLCGLKVGVERGTVQNDDATAQVKKCTDAGKTAVDVKVFPDQNGANLALSSGQVQVVMADSPVAAYAVKQSGGKFKLAGQPYASEPYGIAIPRAKGLAAGTAPMSKPILDALKKLMADGIYTRILQKWGVESGAITSPVINGAVS